MDFVEDFVPPVEISNVSAHVVQVIVSDEDIKERMESFMKLKRNETNAANIREFCRIDPNLEPSGCARLNSICQRRNDSKRHLNVSRALNTYRKDTVSPERGILITPHEVEERPQNVEIHLGFHAPVPKDIYNRIKAAEDRLLHLESISPDYSNFWDKSSTTTQYPKKRIYSIADVDKLIKDAESELG